MPHAYRLRLSASQRQELTDLRDRAIKPYLRERAASRMAVAAGAARRAAGRSAGLKPHKVDSVSRWVHRLESEGVVGLRIREGRGRPPASFPPTPPRRPPPSSRRWSANGRTTTTCRARWWLAGIRAQINWLAQRSLGAVWRTRRQEVLHLRRACDDWIGPQPNVQAWLDHAAVPSEALLRSDGALRPPDSANDMTAAIAHRRASLHHVAPPIQLDNGGRGVYTAHTAGRQRAAFSDGAGQSVRPRRA